MKIILKISISILFLSIVVIVHGQENVSKIAQVKNMAKKYGLQDKLHQNELVFLSNKPEKMVNNYLEQRYAFEQRELAVKKFREKTLYVRSMKDYFELIEKDPVIRKIEVKIHGGEKLYQEYYREMVHYQYRIYRNLNGALAFFKNETPKNSEELEFGQRIDNLSPAKE